MGDVPGAKTSNTKRRWTIEKGEYGRVGYSVPCAKLYDDYSNTLLGSVSLKDFENTRKEKWNLADLFFTTINLIEPGKEKPVRTLLSWCEERDTIHSIVGDYTCYSPTADMVKYWGELSEQRQLHCYG